MMQDDDNRHFHAGNAEDKSLSAADALRVIEKIHLSNALHLLSSSRMIFIIKEFKTEANNFKKIKKMTIGLESAHRVIEPIHFSNTLHIFLRWWG